MGGPYDGVVSSLGHDLHAKALPRRFSSSRENTMAMVIGAEWLHRVLLGIVQMVRGGLRYEQVRRWVDFGPLYGSSKTTHGSRGVS